MRIASFGCFGCAGLLALAGAATVAAAFVPGAVNSSETGTAMAIGGGVCGAAFPALLIGIALFVAGRPKPDAE